MVTEKLDVVQEEDVKQLLDAHSGMARNLAVQLSKGRNDPGKNPHWLSPSFRILNHLLGRTLEAANNDDA
jgi:hypothetical protein